MILVPRSQAFPIFLTILLGTTVSAARGPALLVDVHSVDPAIRVDLSYSHPKNAFHRQLYRSNVALLRLPVAQRLARVQASLRKRGLGLKIWDAYRPRSVQAEMWRLRPDAHSRYVANPRKISKHSRGAAVDVTLVDKDGHELRMPTRHDEFSPRAFRAAIRGVSPEARRNRAVLQEAMQAQGFMPNPYEWWHFTAPEWNRYPAEDRALPAPNQ
jgi:D-alanyl-D-alanine dipeptidase